jgi:hypothetical protein
MIELTICIRLVTKIWICLLLFNFYKSCILLMLALLAQNHLLSLPIIYKYKFKHKKFWIVKNIWEIHAIHIMIIFIVHNIFPNVGFGYHSG